MKDVRADKAQALQDASAGVVVRPPLAALVYRHGKGCRQYAFATAEELGAWAARHPYRNETLRVMPVKGGAFVADRLMSASVAAEFVRDALAANGLVTGCRRQSG